MAKRKVLVVDDEEDFAKALKVRLKANGYDVVLAHDSIQAIMMADQEKPDLIILDILIPGEDGFSISERLKQAEATHAIPIIFLTGVPGGEGRAYKIRSLWLHHETLSTGNVAGDHSQGVGNKGGADRAKTRGDNGRGLLEPPLLAIEVRYHPNVPIPPFLPTFDFCRESNFTLY